MVRLPSWAAAPGAASRRQPVVSFNHLEVCDATGQAVACVRAYLMSFLAPDARPCLKEREPVCFLGMYEDLLNGGAIQAVHLEGLSADRRAEILDLSDGSSGQNEFDENFCRWVDEAVSAIVGQA